MKKLQNNFTTPEQSKRLLDLGLPADSADMLWDGTIDANEGWIFEDFPIYSDKPFSYYQLLYRQEDAVHILPCWSVGRLIEIYCILTGAREFKMHTINTLVEEIIYLLNAIKVNGADFSKLVE